jgi:RNA polymerase sigma factor (sigma-70 family)
MDNLSTLIKEKRKLEQEIEYIWASYEGAKSLDGMPHSSKIADPVCDTACKEIDLLNKLFGIKIQIANLLNDLPPRDRELMELRYIKGYKWALVAKELGISVSHAKFLHKRIIKI